MYRLNPDLTAATASEQLPTVAVIIPCLNEEETIEQVILSAKSALSDARIYVYDNGSTDKTKQIALAAGAIVRSEPRKGKGRALKKAFAEVDADIFVMVDGDDTYDLSQAPKMIELLQQEHLEMVVGNRLSDKASHNRAGHYFGNQVFSKAISKLFSIDVKDPFSGLRVMTSRFVKSFPAAALGFEVETELTVHAYDLGVDFVEIPVGYKLRPENSFSKLKTFEDGFKILIKLTWLYQLKKPLQFYGLISLILFIFSVIAFSIPFIEYLQTSKVSHFPTLIVSMGSFVLSLLSFAIGLISENIYRHSRELKRFIFQNTKRV